MRNGDTAEHFTPYLANGIEELDAAERDGEHDVGALARVRGVLLFQLLNGALGGLGSADVLDQRRSQVLFIQSAVTVSLRKERGDVTIAPELRSRRPAGAGAEPCDAIGWPLF